MKKISTLIYNLCKLELENIYNKKAKGVKICNKYEWNQPVEKPRKFFLNFETVTFKIFF